MPLDASNPYAHLVPQATPATGGDTNPYMSLVPKPPSAPGPSETVNNVVQSTLTPIINFADYPIRATAADIVGLVKGGIPVNAASREAFNKERAASLEQTALPETQFAKSVEGGIGSVLSTIGKYTPPQMAVRALGLEEAAAPFQTMVGDVLGLAGFSRGGAATVKATAEKGASELSDALVDAKAGAAEKFIQGAYTRTIKPSTVGRDTPVQRREAISEIIENKPNLLYTDADGKVVSQGHAPQSIDQFAQAVDQSKSKLFRQWDALAQQSGEAGARVSVTPVVKALRDMAADESERRTRPEAARHAEELANRYEQAGELMPSAAQSDLVKLNNSLRGYYKSPSPVAPAEEVAARELRAALDKTIESSVAPGYQQLRNRYRSLRAIEGDVDRAARRVANRELGGGIFGRGVDLAALGELAAGAGFGHGLEGLAAAAVTKGVGEYIKWRREPNRVVADMFRTAEKYHKPVGAVDTPPAPNTGGMQPMRPSGPGQKIYGRIGPDIGVASGGGTVHSTPSQTPLGQSPVVSDPFLTPPGGGFVQ